jgi:flotillin
MGIQMNQIAARRAAEARDAELQKEVETKKAATELERLRAKDLVRSKIARETAEQDADAKFYTSNRLADGKAYSERQEAEAQFFVTEQATKAAVSRQMQEADAAYHQKMREAEALKAQAEAYKVMADAFGGPQGLLQYMMIQHNVHEKLALANAKAIQGLNPKFTVWNTGSAGGDGAAGDPMASIRNVMQNLPPLLTTINEQTGIQPPNWMIQMPPGQHQAYQQQLAKEAKTNGHARKESFEDWGKKASQ